MADAAIVVSWGTPFPGREALSLGLFMEVSQWWEGKRAAKEVDDFRSYIATTGALSEQGGFMLIEGDAAKLDQLTATEEFRTFIVKGIHLLSGIEVSRFDTGPAIGKAIERVMSVRKQLGIG